MRRPAQSRDRPLPDQSLPAPDQPPLMRRISRRSAAAHAPDRPRARPERPCQERHGEHPKPDRQQVVGQAIGNLELRDPSYESRRSLTVPRRAPGPGGATRDALRPCHQTLSNCAAAFRPFLALYRQNLSYGCSPTRSRPTMKRSRANGEMSTVRAVPSRMSSLIHSPTAGAVLNPVPLWPQSR